jgi:hypothetical protein
MPHTLKNLRRVVQSLLDAMARQEPLEIYAQTRDCDFWYKVYIIAPWGVLRMDTGGEGVQTRPRAWATIRHARLHRVTLDALMENWHQYGIWPRRTIGLMLYTAWRQAQQEGRS